MLLVAAARTLTSRPTQIRSRPAVLGRCSSSSGRLRRCRRRSGHVATSHMAHREKDMSDVEHRPAQQRRESSALITLAGASLAEAAPTSRQANARNVAEWANLMLGSPQTCMVDSHHIKIESDITKKCSASRN